MVKKICILASLSQQSAIKEAVEHYKSEGWLVDYPIEQHNKTLLFPNMMEVLANRLLMKWPLQSIWEYL